MRQVAGEREVVACTKSTFFVLAVSFPHSAAANDINFSFAALLRKEELI